MTCPDDAHPFSRRTLLASGALLGASTVLGLRTRARGDEPTPAPTPADSVERLKAGNSRFAAGAPVAPYRDLARLREVAPEQKPFAAVLGCADSRVPIELLYDQGFGDLFVVRVAGNVASDVAIASLEYGAAVLGVTAVVVLGHSNCGAVKAALGGGKVPGQISLLYQHIAPALNRDTMDLDTAILANVRYQVRKITKGSTVIGPMLAKGTLAVVGGVFDLKSGTVQPMELSSGR